jgi:lysozyme
MLGALQAWRIPWKVLAALVVGGIAGGGLTALLLYRGVIRFNYPSSDRYPIEGVDVSHHQGKIDWARVRGSSVRFAYIKASEGVTFRDSAFRDNWAGARSAGLVPGAYHFFTLCRPGAQQAANFLAAVQKPAEPALPPAVDLEFGGNCAHRPSPSEFRQELEAFVKPVEAAWGCRLVFYVTQEFYAAYVDGSFADNPLWVRDIFDRPVLKSGREWRLWQYANRGRLPGVATYIDLNVFNGTPSEFAAFRCGSG